MFASFHWLFFFVFFFWTKAKNQKKKLFLTFKAHYSPDLSPEVAKLIKTESIFSNHSEQLNILFKKDPPQRCLVLKTM